MSRIAIITQYYNSRNYGGTLQAYALCRSIENAGVKCEQLSYSISHFEKNANARNNRHLIKDFVRVGLNSLTKKELSKRALAFDAFLAQIPHSSKVYKDNNIHEASNDYDIFITGSDQVWNLDWFHAPYFLDFVPKEKKKYSYAASMGGCSIDEKERRYLQTALNDYDDISVREKQTANILSEIISKDVKYVLDPTLLLSEKEWNKVSPERIIKDKYIFCYFLGSDVELRRIAKRVAQDYNLKLVSIPHLQNKTEFHDLLFGDIRLTDASPLDFVSLVRDAEFVLTDSFHATLFSCIFKKQFFVFDRAGYPLMSERIESLCELFSARSHFCRTEEMRTYSYIESTSNLSFDQLDKYKELLHVSKNYLYRIIGRNDEETD